MYGTHAHVFGSIIGIILTIPAYHGVKWLILETTGRQSLSPIGSFGLFMAIFIAVYFLARFGHRFWGR